MAREFKKKITVTHPGGIHAGPASQIVRKVMSFDARLNVGLEGRSVDARSVLGLLTLGVMPGQEIELCSSGKEAEEVLAAVSLLIEGNFEQ